MTQEQIIAQTVDNKIVSVGGDRDVKNSTFGLLHLKGSTVTKSSIKISWSKVKGANTYVVYGNKCGKKYQRIKIASGSSYTQSNLKKGTDYKYMVFALDGENKPVAYSKTVYITTSGGKKVNPSGVKVKSSKKLKLKTKKSSKIKANYTVRKKKKASVHRYLSYESSNKKVATVSKSGKVTAKHKGKCTIYIYAQNGAYSKVQVTVK